MGRPHTDREYENDLRRLREQVLLMGANVEELIIGSMRALVERDSDQARRMIELDHQINQLEVDNDDFCLRILARRQPVASDLRFITIALKLVTDLERIGDLGVNVCERVIELNAEPPLKPYVDLPKMAEAAERMVRDALDAFVQRDAELARAVIERDQIVDAYYAQIFRELLTYMMEDARNIYRAVRVQSIAKYLERIGDHATNLAEMVVFMVHGKDIRHMGRIEERHGGLTGVRRPPPHGVLFLCAHNVARSQMAEGWARRLLPPGVRIWSAATAPGGQVHPCAERVMQEVGIDISRQRPKAVADVPLGDIDTIVVLGCEEVGAVLPPLRRELWELPDPTRATGSEHDVETAFRQVRDELRRRIGELGR